MKLKIFTDYEKMSRAAARGIADQVQARPESVLGLPTGESPKQMFAFLCELHRMYGLDFKRVRTFNLDEYVGVPGSDPRSFRGYMDEHFFRPVGMRPEQIGFLDGTATDLASECKRYDAAIEAAGGIDLIVIGIGTNGHIAFNEPRETFSKGTNIVDLAEPSMGAVIKDFGSREASPRRAITMGVQTIMRCRKIMLLASGAKKAGPIREALTRPVRHDFPATALQLHPAVEVLLDEAAFSQVEPELPITGVQVVRG